MKKHSKGLNNPKLLLEWDYEKNGDLKPEEVSTGSIRKVWWICEKHKHSWEATIFERSINGTDCPYCKNRRVLVGFNDLKTCLPDIAAQWDYEKNGDLRPEMFTPGSNVKVWWRCKNCGHSWKTSITHRSTTNCPYCGSHKVLEGFNDLKTCLPNLAAQWDYEKNGDLRPEMFMPHSNKKVWWRCKKCGRSWKASVNDRSRNTKFPCPYCECHKILVEGFNDLKTCRPDIAAQWDDEKNGELRPEMFMPHSGKKVWWRCKKCGYSWKTSIHHRAMHMQCPNCEKHRLIVGFNDLKTCRPDIATQWDDEKNGNLRPEMFMSNSNKKVWWRCENCGYSWKTSIGMRLRSGCPVCNKCFVKMKTRFMS